MIRVLVLIMITGFLVGLVALSAAVGLGGPDLAARNWEWSAFDWDDRDAPWNDGDHHAGGSSATREMAWDGSTTLVIDIPADVDFTQVPGAGTISITGPEQAVGKVVLENGRLHFNGDSHSGRRLKVTISAPAVTRFEVNGDDHLEINGYKQDRLELRVHGSSDVEVQGEARFVDLDIAGSGEADVGAVATEEAKVDISGSGEATIAPKTAATLEISGSGEVTLLTRPDKLQSDVSGSGRVIQRGPDSDAEATSSL